MVSESHTFHSVGNSLVNEFAYRSHTIQDGVVCMDVKVYEVLHCSRWCDAFFDLRATKLFLFNQKPKYCRCFYRYFNVYIRYKG